jgi:hypothetical protein
MQDVHALYPHCKHRGIAIRIKIYSFSITSYNIFMPLAKGRHSQGQENDPQHIDYLILVDAELLHKRSSSASLWPGHPKMEH